MMATSSTTSIENAFVAQCTQCPRTTTVHQRRRGGLDGFATLTMWHGPRPAGHACAVPASALETNLAMLRERAAEDEANRSVGSSWGFDFAPDDEWAATG